MGAPLAAPSPHPGRAWRAPECKLVGEGGEGGREAVRHPSTLARRLPTRTPNPSPQGGGESERAS
jgi:hypothetical protein